MTMSHSTETGIAMGAKAAPPVTVIGAQLAGIPVADWVQWATLFYVLVMAAHKCWSWYHEWRAKKAVDESA